MSITQLPDEFAKAVVNPHAYAEWDQLHAQLVKVRKEFPFARANLEDYDPFWVASKYRDIQAVCRQNDIFLSGTGGSGMMNREERLLRTEKLGKMFRPIVAMNEPEHAKYRELTQSWFQPRNLRQLDTRIREIARKYIDKMSLMNGRCDFAADIASFFPLMVIMSIIGVPETDEKLMLRLTQEFFGSKDKELNRTKAALTPEEAMQVVTTIIADFTDYFRKVSEEKRRNPSGDLATVIANAEVDGRPISDLESMGMYIEVSTAGHDTTASTLAGAIWALAERPDQLAMVKSDRSLIPGLVEESIRWTTPIFQFVRTAGADCEFQGQQVVKGDRVVLLFPSGNRDEEMFEDPFAFKIDRKFNKHIAFGHGVHMCLGMYLARMQMTIFFEELLPRLRSLELSGKPTRVVSNFIGGPKSVPIRFEFH
jgi:cytochrome P450